MPTKLRIGTFNLENFDDKLGKTPTLDERIALMRPQLVRMDADILCLQEVNGQEVSGQPRRLLALGKLMSGTRYGDYRFVSTLTTGENPRQVFDERNLVVLSHYDIVDHEQFKQQYAPAPSYRMVTAQPPETIPTEVVWERPVLHAQVKLANGQILHVLNVHLKSKLPADVPGQKLDQYTWKTAGGWAEGFFISAMKRVGQALEVRMFLDKLFDADENTLIVVCGDYNSDLEETPLEAILGDVGNTNNGKLNLRMMTPCERSVPVDARYSLFHHGRGTMLDHILVSRSLLELYRHTEIHNEVLHDKSQAFATPNKFPESDHAPVIAEFELPD